MLPARLVALLLVVSALQVLAVGPAVVLYSAGNVAGSAIGSRTQANALCSSSSLATQVQCSGTTAAFVAYTGDVLVNFPTAYSIPKTLPVKDVNGITLASNWAALFVRNGAIPYVQYSSAFWTGSTVDGTAVSYGAGNCGGWQSSSASATIGALASPSVAIGNDVALIQGCSLTFQLMCACNGTV